MQYPFHPLADLFPLIEGHEFEELVASIRDHGLRDAITLCDGSILDGRNRYRACQEAGIEPRFEEFTGTDIHAFVADKNLHRRNLTASQRALVAARMANMEVGNPHLSDKNAIDVNTTIGISQPQAAKLLNVSRDTVLSAKTVIEEGTDEEIRSLETGAASARALADKIRERNPRDRTKDTIGRPQAKSLISAQAHNARRMRAQMWGQLRDGLTAISNLPRPADAASIARAHDKTGLVDAKLFQTLQWMKEFAHVWSQRGEVADQLGSVSEDHTDTGTGD